MHQIEKRTLNVFKILHRHTLVASVHNQAQTVSTGLFGLCAVLMIHHSLSLHVFQVFCELSSHSLLRGTGSSHCDHSITEQFAVIALNSTTTDGQLIFDPSIMKTKNQIKLRHVQL
jgi:hypothetical protein